MVILLAKSLDEFDFFWACAMNINSDKICIKVLLY